MNYNLHPIFVHFPIAFLLLYSFVKIVPWPKKLPSVDWRLPRIVILLGGLAGAWLASLTGEVASELAVHNRTILELHETFANAAIAIYVILLVFELLYFLNTDWLAKKDGQMFRFARALVSFSNKWLASLTISRVLAFCGAILIALTGLFGGVMVYGVSADPLAAPILKFLGVF